MTVLPPVSLLLPYEEIFTSHLGHPILNEVMIFAAENIVYLVPLVLLYLWFTSGSERTHSSLSLGSRPGKTKSVFVFVTIVVGLALSYIMGQLYSHPAPYMAGYETLVVEAPENSFPSQHTTVMFAFAWPLFYLQDRWQGSVALVFASLVGVSRVYVGVHYPIDIIGAVGVSLLGFTVVYAGRGVVVDFASHCVQIEDRLRTALSGAL
ncbi:undecaprenyl-diphosphatase [Halocatena pleomorpha]|uniref:Undecaprenyl-diphosphatase n=1 Tax=Halocatena pleomorpha TaxID=1785090 RepID=A0A3P3R4W6_9EURY|nr:undecaprenyl-diphosphatase [Halocatena pleomorpha]RRJ27633.1 undecaprenyl-diphosphatase [Halocatena pleomorpha]